MPQPYYQDDVREVLRQCSKPGCDRPSRSLGMCRPHYRKHYAANQTKTCSVADCTRKFFSKDLCAVHYTRLRKYGDLELTVRFMGHGATAEERFWSKTERVGQCREWIGGKDKDGYGQCGYIVNGRKVRRAHHLAFYYANGYFAPLLRHTCDNPPCCEPAHLVEGTQTQNIRDKKARGRQARGTRVAGSSLSETEVRRIKRLQSEGVDRKAIIEAIGHNPSAIRHVLKGTTWKHIDADDGE